MCVCGSGSSSSGGDYPGVPRCRGLPCGTHPSTRLSILRSLPLVLFPESALAQADRRYTASLLGGTSWDLQLQEALREERCPLVHPVVNVFRTMVVPVGGTWLAVLVLLMLLVAQPLLVSMAVTSSRSGHVSTNVTAYAMQADMPQRGRGQQQLQPIYDGEGMPTQGEDEEEEEEEGGNSMLADQSRADTFRTGRWTIPAFNFCSGFVREIITRSNRILKGEHTFLKGKIHFRGIPNKKPLSN